MGERGAIPDLRMTRAKRAVLEVLAQFYVLRSKDVARILRGCNPNQSDIRAANRTLLLLDRGGLVYRLKYLDLTNDGVGYACGLSERAVAEYGGKTFSGHAERTIDHELGISFFHVAIRKLCTDRGLTLRWRQADIKRTIHPDAYFSITNPMQEGMNTNHFFLEVERQRMGNTKDGVPSIIRKAERYYRYYNSDQCEAEWGFRTFRVVTIQKTDERRRRFLAALQSDFNHRMFWLGTEPRLVADFRTPKGDIFAFEDFA